MRQSIVTRKSRGQAIITFALMLPVLLGLLGLGVDAVHLFAQRRAVQGAADLAALAGAFDLPDSATATSTARAYATQNGYTNGVDGATVTPTTPYLSDAGTIEVVVRKSVPTFFAGIMGFDTVDVAGRGVASTIVMGGFTIYANKTENPDNGDRNLDVSGSEHRITGRTHSNGDIKVGGSDNTFGMTTYYADDDIGGQRNTFNGQASPTHTGVEPWPLTLNLADFPCTFTISSSSPNLNASANHHVWVNNDPNSRQLRPGVYCSSGEIHLSDSHVTGSVTFIGTRVHLSGSNFNLTPYRNDVLIWAKDTSDDNDAIQISGSNGSWRGTLYARGPGSDLGGQAQLSGSDLTSPSGSIIAYRVKMNGSRHNVTGNAAGGRRWPRLIG